MPTDDYEKKLKAYEEDSRTACQYGVECYQKNPAHRTKYKHPPKKVEKDINTSKKRTSSDRDDESSVTSQQPQAKVQKIDEASTKEHSLSPSPDNSEESDAENKCEPEFTSDEDTTKKEESKNTKVSSSEKTERNSNNKDKVDPSVSNLETKMQNLSPTDPKKIIYDLFLTEMPQDFYKFYEFCKSLSSKDPSRGLKLVGIELVGPYDVLSGKIKQSSEDGADKYLTHWRYYFDPPEFQTILKGDDKTGLHYGYWRDVIEEAPVFVAKNSVNKDCNIEPVGPNIFAAVYKHINEKLQKATPFEKGPMFKLSKQLKKFAEDNRISLENENSEMRKRARNVVAKTFHGAGIVVPYDKKTQLGYRDLAATDSHLKKILKTIDEATSDEKRKEAMAGLEEIVRLATIAADESDFGTCLELGHDIFSSGVVQVQRMGLRMFATAYNLLNRKKFLSIAEAHIKDRKKGSDLSVL